MASTLGQILVRIGQIKPRRRFCNNCIFKASTAAASRRRKPIGNAAQRAIHIKYLKRHDKYTILILNITNIVHSGGR